MTDDRAGKAYWDSHYKPETGRHIFNPHQAGVRNYGKRELNEYFHRVFALIEPQGKDLLEIGSGGSAILPYLHREFGFRVAGLDYSERGCQAARDLLTQEQIPGEVFCADVFSTPFELREQYDVVLSFGVAEHFNDTVACIRSFGHYLKPGGLMITLIPNMVGVVGMLQQKLSRAVYDKHVPIDARALRSVHEGAGLSVLECDYFMFINFGVLNLNEVLRGSAECYVKTLVLQGLRVVTGLTWLAESGLGHFRANRAMSPYIICSARKSL